MLVLENTVPLEIQIMPTEKQKKKISQVLSLLIILGLAYFLVDNWQKFSSVIHLSFYHAAALAIFILITWVIGSFQTIVLMHRAGIQISLLEGIFLLAGMHLGNYLPMRMGTLIRMNYFKKVHNLEYATFSGLFSAKTLVMIVSTSFLGCLGLVGLSLSSKTYPLPILFFYLSITIISLIVCIVPLPRKAKTPHFLWKIWKKFLEGYEIIQRNPILLFQLIFLFIFQYVTLAVRLWISFQVIGKELNPFVYLVLAPTTFFMSIFSITPGNLGLREWFIGFLSVAVGIDLESGLFAGIIDRAVLMMCTFIVGGFSLIYIKIRINKSASEEIDVSDLKSEKRENKSG